MLTLSVAESKWHDAKAAITRIKSAIGTQTTQNTGHSKSLSIKNLTKDVDIVFNCIFDDASAKITLKSKETNSMESFENKIKYITTTELESMMDDIDTTSNLNDTIDDIIIGYDTNNDTNDKLTNNKIASSLKQHEIIFLNESVMYILYISCIV